MKYNSFKKVWDTNDCVFQDIVQLLSLFDLFSQSLCLKVHLLHLKLAWTYILDQAVSHFIEKSVGLLEGDGIALLPRIVINSP